MGCLMKKCLQFSNMWEQIFVSIRDGLDTVTAVSVRYSEIDYNGYL